MKRVAICVFLCLFVMVSGCIAQKNYQSPADKKEAILVEMANDKKDVPEDVIIDRSALKKELRLISGYFHNQTNYGRALRDLRDQDILEEKFAHKLSSFLMSGGFIDPVPISYCPETNDADLFYLIANITDYQKIEMSHDFRFSATKKQIIEIEIDAALYSCSDHQAYASFSRRFEYDQSHSAILSIDLGPDGTQNRQEDVIEKSVAQTLYGLSQNKQ